MREGSHEPRVPSPDGLVGEEEGLRGGRERGEGEGGEGEPRAPETRKGRDAQGDG